jgi:diaminopimelate decarboxylase
MQKALRHGFAPEKIIFSGVGKGSEELTAATQAGVFQINVESFEELQLLEKVARELKRKPRFSLRVNIHVAAPTHKNIQTATEESKFGLDQRQLPEVLKWVQKASTLHFSGLAVHVGSQILDVGVFEQVSRKMGELAQMIRDHHLKLERLDLGGGLGLDYKADGRDDLEVLPSYFKSLMDHHKTGAQVVIEPGRFLVARMGVLCAQVVHVKHGVARRFAILNAGMNALMRPALYQAYHRIERLPSRAGDKVETYDIVGPLCESTDVFASSRESLELKSGDWVGIFDSGAYGAVMANTYNEMPKPLEISVLDGRVEVL